MENTPSEKVKLLKNFIQYEASNRGLSLTKLLAKTSEVYNTNKDLSNFLAKFRRGTITMLEIYQIMDILNIDVTFVERKAP